jgi:hypothetical protein
MLGTAMSLGTPSRLWREIEEAEDQSDNVSLPPMPPLDSETDGDSSEFSSAPSRHTVQQSPAPPSQSVPSPFTSTPQPFSTSTVRPAYTGSSGYTARHRRSFDYAPNFSSLGDESVAASVIAKADELHDERDDMVVISSSDEVPARVTDDSTASSSRQSVAGDNFHAGQVDEREDVRETLAFTRSSHALSHLRSQSRVRKQDELEEKSQKGAMTFLRRSQRPTDHAAKSTSANSSSERYPSPGTGRMGTLNLSNTSSFNDFNRVLQETPVNAQFTEAQALDVTTPQAVFATPKPLLSSGPESLEHRKTHLLSALRLTALRSGARPRLAKGTPHPYRPSRLASVTTPVVDSDDDTSETTSNDLTTLPRTRANTSMPTADRSTRFNGAKLNTYLHTLNTHLTTENQVCKTP